MTTLIQSYRKDRAWPASHGYGRRTSPTVWVGRRVAEPSARFRHWDALNNFAMWYNKQVPSGVTSTPGAVNLIRRSTMESIPHAPGIYQILCVPTGKIYIGSARDLAVRWRTHVSSLQRDQHPNRHLASAWRKHGADAFVFSVIELCFEPCLLEREQYWLDRLRPFGKRGFNICVTAGSVRGVKRSPEFIAQLSERARLRMTDPERRAAVSRVHSGKTISASHRAAAREKQIGRKRPPEVIAKYSNSRARDYILTDPNGTVYEVHNLVQFCKGRDINSSALCAVASGKHPHHKGWICRRK